MIKISHFVICRYCGKKFDCEKEEFVKIANMRYAHKTCNDINNGRLTKESQDRIALEEYIKNLLGQDSINPKVRNQLKEYVDNLHYSYSGMLKTLIYFYDINKNDKSNANGGIGIIPYQYEKAKKYYKAVWTASQKNINKQIGDYKPSVENEIVISPPERDPIRGKKFTFLDEDSLIDEQ